MSCDEKVLKLNEKELQLFEQEKIELYKGTFVVCLTYGLSALLLLIAVLFTTWGKEYIYDKFAPAVITYILGSIIIIFYLLSSIYTIKPRRIGEEVDSNMLCPDFWKLEKVSPGAKQEIIDNNLFSEKNIIPEINTNKNKNIQYRCVSDNKVYGNVSDNLQMKRSLSNNNYNYLAGFTNSNIAQEYINKGKNSILTPQYIVNIPKLNADTDKSIYKDLQKYARFSGAYSANNSNIFYQYNSNAVLRVGNSDYLDGIRSANNKTVLNNYDTKTPLICNVVYPQVLGILDSRTQEGNGISCEYAKQCGISWSSLKCSK
jgi:hypothetical protein